jgi:hypothetical protein
MSNAAAIQVPAADAALPVGRGDWVATRPGLAFQVGRVRDCYASPDGSGGSEVLVDVVLYDTDGNSVGRTSPAMGGPRGFEPAVPYGQWRRIEKPAFPIERKADNAYGEDSEGKPTVRLGFSHHPSVTTKPERVAGLARQAKAPTVRAARTSDYDPASEAAARRLAAQELRDVARNAPGASDALKARAAELEAEADRIAPRR